MGRIAGYLLEVTIFCSVPFASSEKSSSCNPVMWLADLSVTNAGTNSRSVRDVNCASDLPSLPLVAARQRT